MFRRFYDASIKYRQPSLMTKIGVNELIGGDIVLLQSIFTRTLDSENPEEWTVSFELSSLSLLYGAPRVSAPDVDNGFRGEL